MTGITVISLIVRVLGQPDKIKIAVIPEGVQLGEVLPELGDSVFVRHAVDGICFHLQCKGFDGRQEIAISHLRVKLADPIVEFRKIIHDGSSNVRRIAEMDPVEVEAVLVNGLTGGDKVSDSGLDGCSRLIGRQERRNEGKQGGQKKGCETIQGYEPPFACRLFNKARQKNDEKLNEDRQHEQRGRLIILYDLKIPACLEDGPVQEGERQEGDEEKGLYDVGCINHQSSFCSGAGIRPLLVVSSDGLTEKDGQRQKEGCDIGNEF